MSIEIRAERFHKHSLSPELFLVFSYKLCTMFIIAENQAIMRKQFA